MTTQADVKLIGGHYSEQASMKLRGSIRYPEGFKYPTLECCLYVDLLLLDGRQHLAASAQCRRLASDRLRM